MKPQYKIALIILGFFLLAVIAFLIYKSVAKSQGASNTITNTTTGSGGLAGLLDNLGDIWGSVTDIFGNDSGTGEPQCSATKCDPDRPCYNECGDSYSPCCFPS